MGFPGRIERTIQVVHTPARHGGWASELSDLVAYLDAA